MIKPSDLLELLAPLRALLRRATQGSDGILPIVTMHGLPMDFAACEVRITGTLMALTSTEFRLLEELVRHAGTVLPQRVLLEQVWEPEYAHETHYLKVFIRRLRQKIGDDAGYPQYSHTEWGAGYRFTALHP